MGPSGLRSWLPWNVLIIHVILVHCTGIPNLSVHATSMLRGNETDRFALLAFKASVTEDPLGVLRSWNVSVHHCQWHGVTCGHRHPRVTVLNLQSKKLVGSLTPHVGNLSFLRALDLQNNSFTGVIPTELCHLRKLRFLRLNNNSLSGEIPANISSLSNLFVFSLYKNKLVGEIPMEIGALSKLQILYIDNNNLSGGIPPSLGNLTFLEQLIASHNNFLGSIPDALGRLKSLKVFVTTSNTLSGNIPPPIFNLSSLIGFHVSHNQIQGTLPSDLGIALPNLEILDVSYNKFIGSIPVSLSNITSLVRFSSSFNKLTGNLPNFWNLNELRILNVAHNLLGAREADDLSFLSSLTNASNFEFVVLHANHFGGMLPKSISNLSTTLHFLSLGDNHLIGSIPAGLHNLDQLQVLSIHRNHFTGSIPTNIGKLTKLQRLFFADNELSGSIPSSIGNLSLLYELVLEKNNLKGSIPSSLGKCQQLTIIDLSLNNLSGTIPKSVVGISSLSMYLDLSYNHLSGSLPMEIGSLKNLGMLDISKNKLSGEIPSTLSRCLSLQVLYMDVNNFQGIIPPSLSSLRGIQLLDLSRNSLSGKIPDYLEGLDLHYLNLSFNDFDGEVPREGIFKNTSAISIDGNDKLCGGIPELQLPRCNNDRSKKRKLTFTLKLSIFIISGIAGLCFLLCFLFVYWSKNTKRESSSNSQGNSLSNVSYQDLLKATDRFSSANMIGAGSFGSVYKGILDHNGPVIAVKVLNLLRQGAAKSFKAECEALRNVRHRNLVKVITACSGVDYQGNDFKALVYDFMVNGSLESWLHPSSSNDEMTKKLNFLQRLNVSIDVASALDYLHHQCHTQIIHCDLKLSNVLLDNEMIAHVGDFGLAKFVEEATGNSSANEASSIGVRGSVGYTAPEYGLGSKVSMYGDVYSYGILVLEMFTGKRPTDEMFKDGLNLHKYAKAALPDRVTEIADPAIVEELEEKEMNTTHTKSSTRSNEVEECLILVIGVGVDCSVELARERMDISDVIAVLHSIRDIYLGTGRHRHRGTRSTPNCAGN